MVTTEKVVENATSPPVSLQTSLKLLTPGSIRPETAVRAMPLASPGPRSAGSPNPGAAAPRISTASLIRNLHRPFAAGPPSCPPAPMRRALLDSCVPRVTEPHSTKTDEFGSHRGGRAAHLQEMLEVECGFVDLSGADRPSLEILALQLGVGDVASLDRVILDLPRADAVGLDRQRASAQREKDGDRRHHVGECQFLPQDDPCRLDSLR